MSLAIHSSFLDDDFVYVRIEGSASLDDFRVATEEIMKDPRWRAGIKVLFDRRKGAIPSTSAEIDEHIGRVHPVLEAIGPHRVAAVVGTDLDFGMARMFQFKAEAKLNIEYNVFRDLDEACRWLGVDPKLVPGQ